MITIIEIKKAVIQLLKKEFPDVTIYGNEVREGYQTPSFFVQIIPITMCHETVNFNYYKYLIVITCFPKQASEVEHYQMVQRLERVIGRKLLIQTRKIETDEFEFELVGEERNILQISFSLSYHEKEKRTSTAPPATTIYYKNQGGK